jgi:hypothetical protein
MSIATQFRQPNSGFPSFYIKAFIWNRESTRVVAKVFALLGNQINNKALSSLEPKAVSIPQRGRQWQVLPKTMPCYPYQRGCGCHKTL